MRARGKQGFGIRRVVYLLFSKVRSMGGRFALPSAPELLLATVGLALCDRPAPSADTRIHSAASDSANWLMYGRTTDDHRFSPLSQINEKTVAKLGLVWSRELNTTRSLQATPLVANGVMYTTSSWSVVYAIDAKTGAVRWTYDPKVHRERALFLCCDAVNRGAALYRGKVYVGTLDGRLIALEARSGTPVWSVATVDSTRPYTITGYPRIAKGMVVIGNAGAEYGVRGYVSAYDAITGKLRWRTFTVPGNPSLGFESKAMETAAKTWHGEWWNLGGGGTVWEGIVYDPILDLLYFGTGNASTWYRSLRGGGDNLYAASILAVRASDGKLVWHFQVTPGDNWDYDATQPLMQADLTIGGRKRKVIMQANKNGFFYVLDRKTGEFISGAPFVGGITWAIGLDKAGRPIESSAGSAGFKPTMVSPDPGGAHNWNPMAFNPATGLVYLPAKVGTQSVHAPDPHWKYNPNRDNIGFDPRYDGALYAKSTAPPATGELLAWDPVTQRAAWRVSYPVVVGGGVLTTAGNLVFQGRADGILSAYRATDGKQLWQFNAGTGIVAPPVTYMIDGVQFVSLMVGWGGPDGLANAPNGGKVKPGYGRILTFALGGTATLTVAPFGPIGRPTPAISMKATRETVHEGGILYGEFCAGCHGYSAVAGPLPDLRYATKPVHDQFEAIVLGGARASLGMPSFKDLLSVAQVQAIEAFILSRARESATQNNPH